MAATRSLTQSQMAEFVADRLASFGWNIEANVDGRQYDTVGVVKEVFAQLHEVVLDEVEQGVPVNVVNVAKLTPRYTAARKREWGVNPFTGEEGWREARPERITVKATPTAAAKECAPSTRTAAGQKVAKAARRRARTAARR